MTADVAEQQNDCWNRIGVWAPGAKTCPRLNDVVHCHNCDVYSNAGKKLLDRDAPPQYREEWTENLRREKERGEQALSSAFVFRLGDEWFALPTEVLNEVTEIRGIHRIPHNQSRVLRGLVNIRGELHLCVSLGALFGLEKSEPVLTEQRKIHERIVVMERERERYVFPVTEVSAIHRFPREEVGDVPATITGDSGTFLTGVLRLGKRHAGLLDAELLFHALRNRLS